LIERTLQHFVADVRRQLALSLDNRRHLLGWFDARILRDAPGAQEQWKCEPPCNPHALRTDCVSGKFLD
jgi:hypothetical protein